MHFNEESICLFSAYVEDDQFSLFALQKDKSGEGKVEKKDDVKGVFLGA